jgi:hypothetical protein
MGIEEVGGIGDGKTDRDKRAVALSEGAIHKSRERRRDQECRLISA